MNATRKPLFLIQSRYNQWMNHKLYTVCEQVPDEERKQDMGAFFHSIHGTLNHLLLGDRLWMGRFTGTDFPVKSLDQELYRDFKELWRARTDTDECQAPCDYPQSQDHLAEPHPRREPCIRLERSFVPSQSLPLPSPTSS